VGFAVAEPLPTAHRAELRYLGVRPQAWGAGVARRLLAAVPDQLQNRGFIEADLWVYPQNQRAIDLYRRMGWQPSPDVRPNSRTGRDMQRFTLAIGSEPSEPSV
jgi:ribosomal protein S18 acetylase RimI-like enzyme